MRSVLSVALAAAFPLVLLAWLFALSYLEDTLPTDMRSARRKPDPPPILRVPVRASSLAEPAAEPVGEPAREPVGVPVGEPAAAAPPAGAPEPVEPAVPAELELHPPMASGRIDELVELASGGAEQPEQRTLAS